MTSQKFCSMCGQPFEQGDSFCQTCGAKREEENSTANIVKKGKGKKWIPIVVIAVIAVGGIAVFFSLFGKSYAINKVINNTLALESGTIEISYEMESDGYDDNSSVEIEFLKNKEEKTFFVDGDGVAYYASAKDGTLRVADGWSDYEYEFEDELGLDSSKLEADLIKYFADSFKGQHAPEGCVENIETRKEDGKIVITGDLEEEAGLLEWIYGCFDLDELKELVLNNISEDNDQKESFEESWDSAVDDADDEIEDGLDQLQSDIEEYYDVDSSFEIVIDKDGTLGEATVVLGVDEIDGDNSIEITLNMELSEKNEIDSIEEPDFN